MPLLIEKIIDAPVESVWNALTIPEEMRQWYFDVSDFKPQPGFEFDFSGGAEDRVYVHKCKVIEAIKNKKLSYSWRYEGYEGHSIVTFEFFPEANKTLIRLTHTGLETFPPSNSDFKKENFNEGWTYFLTKALPEYLAK
jgi:uncharacterized protein YndB with AHSA1/START domain